MKLSVNTFSDDYRGHDIYLSCPNRVRRHKRWIKRLLSKARRRDSKIVIEEERL